MPKQPYPNAGKLAYYKGETDAVGVAYTIPPGTVFSQCWIIIKAGNPAQPITARLRNELSNGWDRTAASDSQGMVEIKYRTEGAAMLLIQSPGGRQAYEVAVFQGKEIPVHLGLDPPFVSPETAAKLGARQGAGAAAPAPAAAPQTQPEAAATVATQTPTVMWVIAALLGVLVVLGLVMVLRRRPQS